MARSRYGRRSNTSRDMYGRKKVFESEISGSGVKQETVSHFEWMTKHEEITGRIHKSMESEDHKALIEICSALGEKIDIGLTFEEKVEKAWSCQGKASRKEIVKAHHIISSNNNFYEK